MIIYSAAYNGMIYESGYSSLSLHKTREGAELAIAQHKIQQENYYNEAQDMMMAAGHWNRDDIEPYKMQKWEDYKIFEYELLD